MFSYRDCDTSEWVIYLGDDMKIIRVIVVGIEHSLRGDNRKPRFDTIDNTTEVTQFALADPHKGVSI